MTLAAGTKLGPYEILSPLGAGGMGEVYRARDTRLERTVAIKVLPSHLSDNPDLKQRFEREAKAISSLNHPHICTLHDVGSQDGTDFLVMEYLEGETLADRLRRGRLPLEQVLSIGMEVADALDKAHRQGLVHRDLKPGNIMLTKSGAKLMDFGLAKGAAMAIAASSAGPLTPSTPTMSVAALSSPVSPLTQKGQVVGTFQYIAPEVLQGGEADARSDLFAFGCVLYEMTTARQAFEGKSQLSVLTAILEKDPESVRTVVPATPLALDDVITGCLAKDPARRLQSAHDVAMLLGWVDTKAEAAPQSTTASSRMGWIAAAVLLVLMAIGVYLVVRLWPQRPLLRVAIPTPEGMTTELIGDTSAPPTLSPDGTMLVIRAHNKGDTSSALWIRHLDSGAWQRLNGTENADFPFWSPDSKELAFFTSDAEGKLLRINVGSGTISQVAPAPVGRGGSWGSDGTILFTPNFQAGIDRVSASGGTPTEVTKLNRTLQTTHRWPQWLPDGKHFIYFSANHSGADRQEDGIYFASLDGKVNRRVVGTDGSGLYASGYLLYRSAGTLQARPFDPGKGQFTGDPVSISDDVQFDAATWHVSVSASENGELALGQGTQAAGTQLAWFDRAGKQTPVASAARAEYLFLRLSPDGRRAAVIIQGTYNDVWVIDMQRGTPTRLTFDPHDHFSAVWSPDGKQIAFTAGNSAGVTAQQGFGVSLHIRNADGSGKDEELLSGDPSTAVSLLDWTHDGKYLLFRRGVGPVTGALWAVPVSGDHKPFPVVTPPSENVDISDGSISHDGRWVAYTSNESGATEVYVTSFPQAAGKIAVSSGGGVGPRWGHADKELFFTSSGSPQLMTADVKVAGANLQIGQPHALFPWLHVDTPWDVAPDDNRFLATVLPEVGSKPIALITNWTQLVNRK
jgi:serine/threonine protein kinase/Tol biopolymer transport system component